MRRRMVQAVAVMLLAGCGGYAAGRVAPDAPADRPAVVRVGEFEHVPNVEHGQRLDLVMVADGGQLERCESYGGELIYSAFNGWTCEGVDF